MTSNSRYGNALLWAEQLHCGQLRKGRPIPYISHLIAVSALVWQDGGNEDQAIAALLHDAIEDADQSHASIAERFGGAVADIVRDCTDTADGWSGGEKESWPLRKTLFLDGLAQLSETSLLVIAADKAHNAGDMALDARRDPAIWSRFSAGLDGSAWYLLRVHQQLKHRLPHSRSVERLGEAVSEILASQAYRRVVPDGLTPAVWAADYGERIRTTTTFQVGGRLWCTGPRRLARRIWNAVFRLLM
jgi:(p)ppGpp synthase/HD superfamily hydrolase